MYPYPSIRYRPILGPIGSVAGFMDLGSGKELLLSEKVIIDSQNVGCNQLFYYTNQILSTFYKSSVKI
jgi:hypothetical protein